MPKVSVCPEVTQYQRLPSGQLPSAEKEALLNHLEGCEACAQKIAALPKEDSLLEFMRRASLPGQGPAGETVARLVERLTKQGPAQTSTVSSEERTLPPVEPPAPHPLTFRCPGCAKNLKVKASLTGKKVKCPHCHQVVEAPAAAPDHGEARTLPPAVDKAPSVPPKLEDAPTLEGDSPASPGGNTQCHAADKEQEWTEFLAPPQAPDELGRLGSYRVLKVLGAGGMGVVYKAEDPQLKRVVALKAMLPNLGASASARKRFLREAQSAAAIKHDHIVTIHQVGEERGAPFLAMEFLQGEPLEDRLKREGKLPIRDVLRIGREMAEGLAAAHEGGLIHRDIKPANVWLESSPGRKSGEPRVKILDFGLARAADEQQHLTQSGAIVGTPAYMAPEQAQGKKVDGRCDLFSLGCVLYRLCTGEMPFKGSDTISTLMAVATENPPAPHQVSGEVPEALSKLVMQLLAKDPAKRPASASAVAEALDVLAREGDSASLRPARASVARRSRRGLALGVVAGVLLVGALVWAATFVLRTPHGTLTVTTMEADVKVFIDGQEKLTIDSRKVGKIELIPGEHQLTVKRGTEELYTNTFTLKSGGELTLQASWEPRQAAKGPDGTVPKADLLPGASPLDRLDAAKIPPMDRRPWLPKETVAIVGDLNGRVPGVVAIDGLVVSQNGKWLAACGRQFQLYEAATMRLHWGPAADNNLHYAAFLDGGNTLVARDGLWDLTKPEPRLLVSFNEVNVAQLASQGPRLAAFYRDGTIRVWNWAGGKLNELGKASHSVKSEHTYWARLSFFPDGNTLYSAVAQSETTGRLWEVSDSGLKQKADLGRGGVLSGDGKMMVIHEETKPGDATTAGIVLWDLTGPKPQRKETFAVPGLRLLKCFSPDGKSLVLGMGGTLEAVGDPVQIWRIGGERPGSLCEYRVNFYTAAFAPDGKTLFVGRRYHFPAVVALAFDGDKLTKRFEPDARNFGYGPAIFSADGSSLATARADGGNSWWDLTGAMPTEGPRPKGRYIAGLSRQGAFFWNGASMVEGNGQKNQLVKGFPGSRTLPVISADGRTAVVTNPGNTDTPLEIHDLTGDKITKMASFKGAGRYQISSDGKVVLASDEKEAHLFRRKGDGWKEIWGAKHLGVALSSRGDKFALLPDGGAVLILDIGSGPPRESARLPGMAHIGECVSFTPDSRRIAMGNAHGTVRVCEIETGDRLHEWQFPGEISGLTYAPDGRHLAVSNSGVTFILRLPPPEKAAR